jgi:hypothetical protein
LAVDEGWQHEPPAGLAEPVPGLLAVIAACCRSSLAWYLSTVP